MALQALDSRSEPGPDRVPNRAFKNLDGVSIEALTKFFSKCWRTGVMPKKWKHSKMILIPKPGKPPSTGNLRPISLSSCLGKALERALMARWQDYLEDYNVYPETMIGFR